MPWAAPTTWRERPWVDGHRKTPSTVTPTLGGVLAGVVLVGFPAAVQGANRVPSARTLGAVEGLLLVHLEQAVGRAPERLARGDGHSLPARRIEQRVPAAGELHQEMGGVEEGGVAVPERADVAHRLRPGHVARRRVVPLQAQVEAHVGLGERLLPWDGRRPGEDAVQGRRHEREGASALELSGQRPQRRAGGEGDPDGLGVVEAVGVVGVRRAGGADLRAAEGQEVPSAQRVVAGPAEELVDRLRPGDRPRGRQRLERRRLGVGQVEVEIDRGGRPLHGGDGRPGDRVEDCHGGRGVAAVAEQAEVPLLFAGRRYVRDQDVLRAVPDHRAGRRVDALDVDQRVVRSVDGHEIHDVVVHDVQRRGQARDDGGHGVGMGPDDAAGVGRHALDVQVVRGVGGDDDGRSLRRHGTADHVQRRGREGRGLCHGGGGGRRRCQRPGDQSSGDCRAGGARPTRGTYPRAGTAVDARDHRPIEARRAETRASARGRGDLSEPAERPYGMEAMRRDGRERESSHTRARCDLSSRPAPPNPRSHCPRSTSARPRRPAALRRR